MTVRTLLGLGILAVSLPTVAQQSITSDNTDVKANANVKLGTYTVADQDRNGVVRVTTDDVTLDFQGATLLSGPLKDNDKFEGIGLLIENRHNVTIKNAKIHGYQTNILVRNCTNVRLENCDVGQSRSIRIMRGTTPVDLFLNLRDIAAWRTYGAGIWVEKTSGATVVKCTGQGAQNGCVLVDTSKSLVENNNFSFNSGWGIAMWGSDDNVVDWNQLDFVNRPWAGFWGGDSAALAMAAGSDRNYIVGNSMTHSGDGFFLTHRADNFDEANKKVTLTDPSNDNIIAYNDGSWSTANAFEGTFSTGNVYYKNVANDSAAAGFWLGYSDDSLVIDNIVSRNRSYGIGIEHGSRNLLQGNYLTGQPDTAIGLWASQNWVGDAHSSANNDVIDNILVENGKDFFLQNSRHFFVQDPASRPTRIPEGDAPRRAMTRNTKDGAAAFLASERYAKLQEIVKAKPDGFVMYPRRDPSSNPAEPVGYKWIQAGEFAPIDFRGSLVAWRLNDPDRLELFLLDPQARVQRPPAWMVADDPETGAKTFFVYAKDPNDGVGIERPYEINLTSPSGKTQTINGIFRTTVWDVSWYHWTRKSADFYDDGAGWKKLFASKPITDQTLNEINADYTGRKPTPSVDASYFAMVATTKVRFDAGSYRFSSLSDDGIRVFLDGKEIISRWNHHGPTADEAVIPVTKGVHTLRVEYCQETGSAVLRFNWERMNP